jgi:hypothetical protein
MADESLFIEVDFCQVRKKRENICGDAFYSQKIPEEERVISVLSDGLGSGVKANILASMTARMAVRFAAGDMDFTRCAEVMMDALPVCQVRRISYATFTIIDTRAHGETRIIEMDNPPFLLVRGGVVVPVAMEEITSERWPDRKLRMSHLVMQPEDRIVVCSDGITQAGLGNPRYPLGWREDGCRDFVLDRVTRDPQVSARRLARAVVSGAIDKEPEHQAHDDMTAGVIYFRKPRKLLLLTGPPFDRANDAVYARMLDQFDGRRVICGGSTANIVARELGREITMSLEDSTGDLPPLSRMPGVDLVTEGILTLTHTARVLEGSAPVNGNAASKLAELLRDSDRIEFVVGSRINEAHQDPQLPMDVEIRRNIVRRMAQCLEEKYLKEVTMKCI